MIKPTWKRDLKKQKLYRIAKEEKVYHLNFKKVGAQQGGTHPSTAGERSGRLLPLDLYLLCVCRRGGRLGPQWSPPPPPKGPPRFPLRPPGTEPPNGPPPKPSPPAPPGTRGSESGLSRSTMNGRSTNRSCQSCSREKCEKKIAFFCKNTYCIIRNLLQVAILDYK